MRKKSHISLAGYLVRELRAENLVKHKKAFYLGSVLPDLNPKMLAVPHEFITSYEELQDTIRQILADGEAGACKDRVLWRRIGVVIHYLADYFTFPHNQSYDGNLKDHCLYERDMKYSMREFVKTPEAMMIFRAQKNDPVSLESAEALFAYIEETHRAYMQQEHTAPDDCKWILTLCSRVLLAIVNLISDESGSMSPALWYRAA